MTTAYLTHSACQLHEMGAHHPECPARLTAIGDHLQHTGLMAELHRVEAQPVTTEYLSQTHSAAHVAQLYAMQPQRGIAAIDGDTALCPQSIRAAELAAGAVVQAVAGVYGGQFDNAFCAVRPPGHHAEYAVSMGFCLFNNVAVGVRYAQQYHRVWRVAVLDFDVHHGNGTVDIFKDDPAVLVCSSFQHPFYPGRYATLERPNIVNTPLPAGTDGALFRRVIARDWLPALAAHRPELILVSAGFDAHAEDPLGGLNLNEEDFRWVTQLSLEAAANYAQNRLVSVLEGGYALNALARSVAAHIEVLLVR